MPRGVIQPEEHAVVVIPKGTPVTLKGAEIEPDPAVNVRGETDPAEEAKLIDNLARAIFEQGQISPVLVRRNGPGGAYKLIAGNRRLRAIRLIGEKTGQEWPVQALLVDKDDNQAWDAAFSENFNRRQFNPIELARNMQTLRGRMGLGQDEGWARKVGDHLHVSRAMVLQHVKLLTLDPEIQAKVAAGVLSLEAAIHLVNLDAARADGMEEADPKAVLKKAEEAAEQEERARVAEERTRTAQGMRKGRANAPEAESASKNGKSPEKGRVKGRHVLAAVRETAVPGFVKPRTRTEIVKFLGGLSEEVAPDPCSKFLQALEKYCGGELTDKSMTARWYAITELVEAGLKVKARAKAR